MDCIHLNNFYREKVYKIIRGIICEICEIFKNT